MRITLVDNLLLLRQAGVMSYDLQPHLGLISLIAVAEAAGHSCVLYDPKLELFREQLPFDSRLYEEMARAILRTEPEVVGFTSLGCNFICTVQVASLLKSRRPDLPILLGGPHATILDRDILLTFPVFDYIVRNEGERKFAPLLAAIGGRTLPEVGGVSFRVGNDVVRTPGDPVIDDLDELPFPAYKAYPLAELNLTSIRVEAGRGCPFKCTFCSTASFFGRRYRLKSPHKLVGELKYLHSNYGISDFSLTHDLFTVDKRAVLSFCDAVRPNKFTWTCSARMDCVDDALLAEMRSAGCRSIYYGVETGSSRLQRVTEKRLDLELYEPVLRKTVSLGMAATASFITGYPEENEQDQLDTLDRLGHAFRYNEDQVRLQLHLLTPEPGTALMAKYGPGLLYDGHVTDFNFPTLGKDDDAIMGTHPGIFMNHHYFPTNLPRQRHIAVTELFAHLRGLGHSVVRHVLEEKFGGSLGNLVEQYLVSSAKNQLPPDMPTVIQFFENQLGSSHYLAQVIRYLLFVRELPPCSGGTEDDCADLSARYRISESAFVFLNTTNVPTALRYINDKLCAPDEIAIFKRERVNLMVVKLDGDGACRNFLLDPPTGSMLKCIQGRKDGLPLSRILSLGEDFPIRLGLFASFVRSVPLNEQPIPELDFGPSDKRWQLVDLAHSKS